MYVAYKLGRTEAEIHDMEAETFSRWVGFLMLEDEKEQGRKKARGF